MKSKEKIKIKRVHCTLYTETQPASVCSFAADPVVFRVLSIPSVPDAQVISERSSHAHSRLHWPRGSLSTCAVLSFTYQGNQRGAPKTLPETTSIGRLPQLRPYLAQTLAKLRPQLVIELAGFKHAT